MAQKRVFQKGELRSEDLYGSKGGFQALRTVTLRRISFVGGGEEAGGGL